MQLPWAFFLLIAAHCSDFLVLQCAAFDGVADLMSGELLTREWIEAGFVDLDDAEWVTVTTNSLDFNAENVTNLAIFISLPVYGGNMTNCLQ
jgi:hypothetical protein